MIKLARDGTKITKEQIAEINREAEKFIKKMHRKIRRWDKWTKRINRLIAWCKK